MTDRKAATKDCTFDITRDDLTSTMVGCFKWNCNWKAQSIALDRGRHIKKPEANKVPITLLYSLEKIRNSLLAIHTGHDPFGRNLWWTL